jgi:hypothetical protein
MGQGGVQDPKNLPTPTGYYPRKGGGFYQLPQKENPYNMDWGNYFKEMGGGQPMPTPFENRPSEFADSFLAGKGSPFDLSDLKSASTSPLANQSAQNTAQFSKESSDKQMQDLQDIHKMQSGDYSNISEAFKAIQEAYKPYAGRGIAGSEDIRVKSDVHGRPYTVVDVSPQEHRGIESGMGALSDFSSLRPLQASSEMQDAVSMAAKRFKAQKSGQSGVGYGFDDSITGNPYK